MSCSFRSLLLGLTIIASVWLVLGLFTWYLDANGYWIGIHSNVSSTKSKLYTLKSSLLSFKSDFGSFPGFCKDPVDEKTYFPGKTDNLGPEFPLNCLFLPATDESLMFGLDAIEYNRRCKGPYLDDSPEYYFVDQWGMPIVYFPYDKFLYLWSAGRDGNFEDPEVFLRLKEPGVVESTDDILITVKEFRKVINMDIPDIKNLILAAKAKSRRKPGPSILFKTAAYVYVYGHPLFIYEGLKNYFF